VAFASTADNLVYYGLGGFPTGSPSEVYTRDTLTCATTLVSLAAPSTPMAAPGATRPSISDDGRYTVFLCTGTVCGAGSTGDNNVVRFDRDSGVTAALSVAGSTNPNGNSYLPSISGDGRYVAFASNNNTLDSCTGTCYAQVYLSDSDVGANPPWAWQGTPSGIDGGGFVNTLAIDPSGTYSGRVAAGGDVAGVQISTNSGDSWTPSNTDGSGYVPSNYNNTFASLAWAGQNLYGLTGNGTNGALVKSTDGGTTWTKATPSLVGYGGGSSHPRPTGQLIDTALYSSNLLYVGTSTGVYSYNTNSNATSKIWPIGTGTAQVTGLIADPTTTSTSTAYVTVAAGTNEGVYKLTGINGTLAANPITTTSSVTAPLAVAAVTESSHTALYVVGPGVNHCTTTGGSYSCATVPLSGTGITPPSTTTAGDCNYSTVAAEISGSTTTAYVGCSFIPLNSVSYHNPLVKVTFSSGTTTVSPLPAGAANILTTIDGPAGTPWWLTNANDQPYPENNSHPEESLGGHSAVAAQVVIDPTDTSRLFVAGRGGVFRSTDGGANWYPVVNGLAVTVDRRVVVNPDNPAQVADGDVDWSTQASSARLTDPTALLEPPPSAYKTSTYSMALDTIPTTPVLYVGLGNSNDNTQQTGGGVCSTNPWPTPPAAISFTCIAGPQSGPLVAGLAVGEPSGTPTLIAVIASDPTGDGVYYSTKSGGMWSAWTAANTGGTPIAPNDANKHVSIWWGQSGGVTSGYLYIYDPDTGLWRSSNKGVNWTNIDPTGDSLADPNGYLAGDPASPNRLYLSLPDVPAHVGTVEEIVDGSAPTLVTHPLTSTSSCWDTATAGPITVDPNGLVYLTQHTTASCPASLYQASAGATAMTQIDDAGYNAQALFPNDIAASADGYLYIPTAGESVDVQVPIDRCHTSC
jgi:hypothetical protein